MAKDKTPRPIHFQMGKESEYIAQKTFAMRRMQDLVSKGHHKDIYLVYTSHWSGWGFWIMFALPDMLQDGLDELITHKHNKNPKPYIPPPPPRKKDEDEEEEE